jgi:hypothetical protein
MPKAKDQHDLPVTRRNPQTPSDLDISKPQPSRWHKLAGVPELGIEGRAILGMLRFWVSSPFDSAL